LARTTHQGVGSLSAGSHAASFCAKLAEACAGLVEGSSKNCIEAAEGRFGNACRRNIAAAFAPLKQMRAIEG